MLFFILGAICDRAGVFDILYDQIGELIEGNSKLKGLTVAAPLRLRIEIDQEDFKTIRSKRAEALNDGFLLTDKDDYVPCKIYQGRDSTTGKIRLKGDYSSHFETTLWSYRIKLKSNDAVMGMNRFSLHHPRERNYIYEWMFHQIMRHEGIIALKYDFVDVYINGASAGLYAIEEHFEKQMLENNQRKEGPILKFDEETLWQNRMHTVDHDDQAYNTSRLTLFKPNYTSKDSSLSELAQKGIAMLHAFRTGRANASEIFNVTQTAKFYALSDIMGAHHIRHFHNLRFYLDPLSGLLEPIAFDADAGQIIGELLVHRDLKEEGDYTAFTKKLFSDEVMLEAYYKMLHKYTDTVYCNNWNGILKIDLAERLYMLYNAYPDFNYSDKWLGKNQKTIAALLNPGHPLEAYLSTGNLLFVTNLQAIPIKLQYLCNENDTIYLGNEAIVSSYHGINVPQFQKFSLTSAKVNAKWELCFSLPVSDEILSTEINPWPFPGNINWVNSKSNINDFDFLKIDERSRTIIIKNGNNKLIKNLIIPEGYNVFGTAPLTIELINGASIISRSSIDLRGSEDEPIMIGSSTETGAIVILNAETESAFEHVHFKGLGGGFDNNLSYPAGVTIFKSPVSFSSCIVEDIYTEDAINIVNSEFVIRNSSIISCKGDGIDIDFSIGKIEEVNILKCKNDGLDLSGSNIQIKDLKISETDDKGISIGERSFMEADLISIERCNEALAVKDQSEVRIGELRVKNCQVAVAAFVKKKAYGPAFAVIRNLLIADVERSFRTENESYIVFDKDTIR